MLSSARLVVGLWLALEPCDSFVAQSPSVSFVASILPSVFRRDPFLLSKKFTTSELSKSCKYSYTGESPAHSRPSSTALHQRKKLSSHSRQQRHRRYLPSHRRFEDGSRRDSRSNEREFIDQYQIFQLVEEEYAKIQARCISGQHSPKQNKPKNRFLLKNTIDVESKLKLISPRTYGGPKLLFRESLNRLPMLGDLNQEPGKVQDTYWKQPIFRLGVVAASYFSFPLWCMVFEKFVTVDPDRFNTMVRQIAPNVGKFVN